MLVPRSLPLALTAVYWLPCELRGLEAALAVGRVDTGPFTATDFLVGPNIVLTKRHVLPSRDDATLACFDLDAEENRYGDLKRVEMFGPCPDVFWVPSRELDFTFVAIGPVSLTGRPLSAYGWHPWLPARARSGWARASASFSTRRGG